MRSIPGDGRSRCLAADICREAFATLDVLEPPIRLAPWHLTELWSRRRSGDAGLAWLARIAHSPSPSRPAA